MRADEQRPGLIAARAVGGLALLGGALLVLRPFLVAIVWAAILAYVTQPLFRRAREWSRRPRASAALFTLVAALVLVVPLSWFLVTLAQQATELVGVVQGWVQAGAPLPGWLTDNRWLGPRLEDLRALAVPDSGKVASYAVEFGQQVSGQLVGVASGIARNAFTAAITLVTLYVFYAEGDRLMAHARRLVAVVFPNAPPEFLDNVGAVVRAVVFGLVGTALVQGALAALGLALFGVPSPLALGAATAVLSFVPAGPPLVWGGAAVWLFVSGHTGAAIGMALWGVFLVSSVDNVLRPLLISSGSTRIPFLLVFFGVLGGLMAFGLLGLFIGPVLLSVTFALLAEFPPQPAASASDVQGVSAVGGQPLDEQEGQGTSR